MLYQLKQKITLLKERIARWLAPNFVSRYETAFKTALEISKMREIKETIICYKQCDCKCKKHKVKAGASNV